MNWKRVDTYDGLVLIYGLTVLSTILYREAPDWVFWLCLILLVFVLVSVAGLILKKPWGRTLAEMSWMRGKHFRLRRVLLSMFTLAIAIYQTVLGEYASAATFYALAAWFTFTAVKLWRYCRFDG